MKILDWTTINSELMHKLFASPMPSFMEGTVDQPHQQQQQQQEKMIDRASDNDNDDPLKFRQFPKHHEYAHGLSGLCDSVSIQKAATESMPDSGSVESLPDVELEAKKRNLIIGNVNSNSNDNNWTELPNINDKNQQQQQTSSSVSTSDTFEDELNKMKLNWAGSMVRKTKKLHAMTSSSSSSIDNHPVIAVSTGGGIPKDSFIDSNITNHSATISLSSTASDTTNGNNKKPLNLKEFFAKELLRRTQSLSSSSTLSTSSPLLDDSTLSSNFLRSLLATSRSSRSDGGKNLIGTTTGLTDKHTTTQRTSTPNKLISTDSTSLSNDGGLTKVATTTGGEDNRNDAHLFSGESRLSSVKNNSSSSSSTNTNDGKKVTDATTKT